MKPNFKILFTILILCATSLSTFSSNRNLHLNFRKISNLTDLENPEEENNGRKKPSMPISCCIDEEGGIIFSNYDSIEITSFYILNNNDEYIGIFNDELTFISFLFTLHGSYKIIFETENNYLIGMVEL